MWAAAETRFWRNNAAVYDAHAMLPQGTVILQPLQRAGKQALPAWGDVEPSVGMPASYCGIKPLHNHLSGCGLDASTPAASWPMSGS